MNRRAFVTALGAMLAAPLAVPRRDRGHSGALAHEERVVGLAVGRSMTEHPGA